MDETRAALEDKTDLAAATRLPGRLLRRFIALAVIGMAGILGLAAFGFHRVYVNEMTKMAEDTVLQLGQLVTESEHDTLLRLQDGRLTLGIDPRDAQRFDVRMRRLLQTFHIHRLKLFALDRTIVYSDDPALIGSAESTNATLAAALERGENASKLEEIAETGKPARDAAAALTVVESYVPIRIGDKVVGAFEAYIDVTQAHERVDSALRGTLSILALLLFLAFFTLLIPMRQGLETLQKVSSQLHRYASTDALTGVLNRHSLFHALREERTRLIRTAEKGSDQTLAILMIDLDHFKHINDNHGHLVGDDVLQQAARRLRTALRPYDSLGRYGGEEFVALLPGTCLAEALAAARRLHGAIAGTPFLCDGLRLPITTSIGVAVGHQATEAVEAVLARADAALYEAKAAGRNRVHTLESSAGGA